MIDLPGGGGKIPLIPEYVLESKEDELLVKNYLGEKYGYPLLSSEAPPQTNK
jgi:lysine 2,3-aminomutase